VQTVLQVLSVGVCLTHTPYEGGTP